MKFLNKRLFFLLFLVPQLVFSHGWEKHVSDMREVIGIKNTKSNREIIDPLLKLISISIDGGTQYNEDSIYGENKYYQKGHNEAFYRGLTTKYQGFSYGVYGHRLMYHWGFDYGDPRNLQALKSQFNESAIFNTSSKDFDKFINDIQNEQAEKSKILRKAVGNFFDIEASREYTRGLSGLFYYVHLLGDHIEHSENTEKTVEAVLSVRIISDNIDKMVKDLSNHGSQAEYKKYKKAMDKCRNEFDSSDEKNAQLILDTLIKYVPSIIKKNLKNTFERKKISLK